MTLRHFQLKEAIYVYVLTPILLKFPMIWYYNENVFKERFKTVSKYRLDESHWGHKDCTD